jgi:DNA mismatch endonuclease Vsr
MRRNLRSGTRPEVLVRSELHRRGLRFRKDLPLRLPDRVVRPDIVFTRARLAVFIDGCFWHACPIHGNQPRTNIDYWGPKLAGNVARDRAVDAALVAAGWQVLRVWEHEDPVASADRASEVLAARCAG